MQLTNYVVAFAGLAAGAQALTSQQVVVNINAVTSVSADTDKIAKTVTPFNIFTTIPRIINNFRIIAQDVSNDIAAMARDTQAAAQSNAQKVVYAANDQQAICDSFRNFVAVHQALLATVIGKSSLAAQTPFAAPMAAVLRVIEGGVDTFAYNLIDSVPNCASDAKTQLAGLDKSLQTAVSSYTFSFGGSVGGSFGRTA